MTEILITGGCGFVGSNVAADALAAGHVVTVFDNLSRHGGDQNLAWLRTQGLHRFVHGDIRNADDVRSLIEEAQPEAVFHLAGQVAMNVSLERPRLDFEINAGGTFNVLEAVRECAPHAVVGYSSSNKVYGDLEQFTYIEEETRFTCEEKPNGFDESLPLDFHSPYGCSKGAADQYMLDFARMYGLKTAVFRHSSMYGARQFATVNQGWIGWFCDQAIRIKNQEISGFSISGTGKQVRDVLHCQDISSLYLKLLSADAGAFGQAYNIGGGIDQSLSLLELFALQSQLLGFEFDVERKDARPGDQRFFVADNGKATRLLGWEPTVEVSDGLEKMISWAREHV